MKLDNEEVYKKLIKCFVVKAHILYGNNLAQLPRKKISFMILLSNQNMIFRTLLKTLHHELFIHQQFFLQYFD